MGFGGGECEVESEIEKNGESIWEIWGGMWSMGDMVEIWGT